MEVLEKGYPTVKLMLIAEENKLINELKVSTSNKNNGRSLMRLVLSVKNKTTWC